MSIGDLEKRFLARLLRDVDIAKKKYNYHAPRFVQMLASLGPRRAAKQLLEGDVPAEGFATLFERGQHDGLKLSLEWVVATEDEWHPLFERDEVDRARNRLIKVNMPLAVVPGVVRSSTAAEPVGPYPHARRAGNLLFLSGIGPRKRGSKEIPGATVDATGRLVDYSIEAEMRSCFENIRIVLEEAGSSWDRIIDCACFLTDMKRDWATYNRVYGEFFPPGPNQPTRTTVEVSALPTGGNTPIHFEIKVVAGV